MKRNFALVVVCTLVGLLLVVAPAATAQPKNAEQIVFSGVGFGAFNGTPSPFGFWVWCEDEEAGNPYQGVCAGAIYIYALGLTRGVHGTVSEEDGSYTMHVASSDSAIVCSLTNTLPVTRGPTNTVQMSCTAPAGSGISTNSVVVVTGP